MHRIIFSSIFFAFCYCSLLAEEREPTVSLPSDSFAYTDGMPSNMVHDSVCVMSGEYCESCTDFDIPGPENLSLERNYCSFKPAGIVGVGWYHNHYETLRRGSLLSRKDTYGMSVPMHSGNLVGYTHPKMHDYKKQSGLRYAMCDVVGKTVIGGKFSGRTNIKNQIVHHIPSLDQVQIVTPEGHFDIYHFVRDNYYKRVSRLKLNGFLIQSKSKEIKQDGEKVTLRQTTMSNPETGQIFNYFKTITRDSSEEIQTSDGQEFKYTYRKQTYKVDVINDAGQPDKQKIEAKYLKQVSSPSLPTRSYDFTSRETSKKWQISRKKLPDNRYLEIDHYKKGDNHVAGINIKIKDDDEPCLDRVKFLKAPVGVDEKAIPIYSFIYMLNMIKKDGRKEYDGGTTDVRDAHGTLTRYRYDRNQRLSSVEQFSEIGSYLFNNFVWDSQGHLKGQYVTDSQGKIQYYNQYEYDDRGNTLKHTLIGNLSGACSANILLDKNSMPIENGCEKSSTSYTYTSEWLNSNILKTETDSRGKTIHYAYLKGDIPSAIYVSYDGQIKNRDFFHYDVNKVLIKKISDDGSGLDQNDLSNVTERLISYIQPRQTAPFGLPERIDERYVDWETNQEILLKSLVNHHSKRGQLVQQDIYDSEGTFCYSLKWEYDDHNNLIKEINALGEEVHRKYDANDNLIEQTTSGAAFTTRSTYDFANRLIAQEERHDDTNRYHTANRYDYLNRCVGSTDAYGNETAYVYDALGRVTTQYHPAVEDENGVLAAPVTRKFYDWADNPICVIDPKGQTTHSAYNIRQKPCHIVYQDGTEEIFVYDLHGELSEYTERNGKKTIYQRDPLGRVTLERCFGRDNVELKCKQNFYNSKHIIASIDSEGVKTVYQYDPAGRLKRTTVEDQVKEYFYDTLGRLKETREWFGTGEQDYRSSIVIHDYLNRPIEERLEGPDHTVYRLSRYAYDEFGNKILEQQGEQITRKIFNAHQQPISITNPAGETTHIVYKLDFVNEHGQRVLKSIATDPMGFQTVDIYNTHQKIVQTMRLNPMGCIVSHQKIYYDLAGCKVRTVDVVLHEGKEVGQIFTHFSYNIANQLIAQIEAAGTLEQKITRYTYNAFGEKETLIKPDGNVIKHCYDTFGRVSNIISSDGSLHYRYTYDKRDLVTRVEDLIAQTSTERTYDAFGRMLTETLANGLTLSYTYDAIGRVQRLGLPDQSAIEFLFGPYHLEAIQRYVNGEMQYQHCEVAHHLGGMVSEAVLAGHNGTIRYAYDQAERCTGIESPSFQQAINSGGFDASGRLLEFHIADMPYRFTYDDLSQLASEEGHESHRYKHDSINNRIAKDDQPHDINALNQLLKRGDDTFAYDANGNMTQQTIDEVTTSYEYDIFDRLVAVKIGDFTVQYTYDAYNRRISRQFPEQEPELFLYQGLEEVGMWKAGQLAQLKVLSPTVRGVSVAVELNQQVYVPIQDLFGHVVRLLDLAGNVVEQYKYTAFGETQIFDASEQRIESSMVDNPWRFSNKRYDQESKLYAFGLRYYHADLGRWITTDPSGFADGPNLYAYVHNSPLLFTDALGLFGQSIFNGFTSWISSIMQPFSRLFSCLYRDLSDPFDSKGVNDGLAPNRRPLAKHMPRAHVRTFTTANPTENTSAGGLTKWISGFINGIMNGTNDWDSNAGQVSEIDGGNVGGVYSASWGLGNDILYYCLRSLFCLDSPESRLLRKQWDAGLLSDPNARYEQHCHSRGCVYVRNALMRYSPELRQRIDVIAVAPGAYIDKNLCGSVTHIVSKNDWVVPNLDRGGKQLAMNQKTIRMVDRHPDASWVMDHSYLSPTYFPHINERIDLLRKKHP